MNEYIYGGRSMQDKITIYCKVCNKTTKVSHYLTGNDETIVMPNTAIACSHHSRVIRFKGITEGHLKKYAKGDRFYI